MKLSRLVLLLGCVFLLACKKEKQSRTDVYQLVPTSSVVVAEINDLPDLVEAQGKSSILNTLLQTPGMKSFQNAVELYTGNLPERDLNNFLGNRSFLVTVNLSGAEKYDLLFITKGNSEFEKVLSTHWNATFDSEVLPYAEQQIFHFMPKGSKTSLYVSSVGGSLVFSARKSLVEEAIRQSQSEYGIRQDADFEKLMQTLNPKDLASLFINLEKAPGLTQTLLPEGDAGFLAKMGSWVELDLQSTEQQIFLSGLLLYPEGSPYFTDIFKNISAHQAQSDKIIPGSFGLWVNYNFSNIGQYYRNYQQYLETSGQLNDHKKLLEKLPPNATAELESWIDNEMGIFESGRSSEISNQFAYLKFRGEAEECSQSLQKFSDSTFVEGYRGYIIRKLSAQNLLARVYGPLFKELHFPHYTLVRNYVIFGSNLAALKVVINDIEANKTLAANASWQEFNEQLPGNAHISAVVSNPEFLALLKDLAPQASKALESHSDSLQNLKWGALQLKAEKEGAFTNLMFQYDRPVKEKVTRKWTTQLPHQPQGEPQMLKNHVNHKYDIAIADEENHLYLLDKNGTKLWEYELDEPILGDIRQIDIFKNNKLQMVFNTAQQLYVLDRLGRNVEGFPVKLPAKATAPVGVFNYDQARNYRLVVPVGPKLLNFDVEGKAVEGWAFEPANSAIVSEPQHFSVAGKDIIVCLSKEGKLYQLNRRGEERFVVEEKIEELKTSFYLKEGKTLKESELLAGSNSGKMYVINPQGKIDALYLDETKPADHLIYFAERYIFSHDEELIVKDEEKPFTALFEDDISTKPKAMVLGNRFYVGGYSAGQEEIRVFNENGELLDGFPIFAQGPFDMGSLNLNGKLNIITYSSDGTVICYEVQ